MLVCLLPLLLLCWAEHLLEDSVGGSFRGTAGLRSPQSNGTDPRMLCSPLNDAPSGLQVSMLPLVHWEREITKSDQRVKHLYHSFVILTVYVLKSKLFHRDILWQQCAKTVKTENSPKPLCLTMIFSTSGIRKLYTNSDTISSDWRLFRLPTHHLFC